MVSPWLLFLIVFSRNVSCQARPDDIIPLRKDEYLCSHEILTLSPVVLKWRYLPSCYSLFLYSSATSSNFWTDSSVAIFFPFQQEPSGVPKLFNCTFCVLGSSLCLALFCQRKGKSSSSLCNHKKYISTKLKFVNGLKRLFNLAVPWLFSSKLCISVHV